MPRKNLGKQKKEQGCPVVTCRETEIRVYSNLIRRTFLEKLQEKRIVGKRSSKGTEQEVTNTVPHTVYGKGGRASAPLQIVLAIPLQLLDWFSVSPSW